MSQVSYQYLTIQNLNFSYYLYNVETSKNNNTSNQKASNVYEQRFIMLMKLIRIDRMLKSAKIVHPKK